MEFYLVLFIFGVIVGSFVNVLIYRIPRNQGFISGRSSCPKCDKELKWHDLIPVLSFIFLRGKCRYCKNPINPVYVLVELYSGAMFVLIASFMFNPFEGVWVSWLFYVIFAELMVVLLVIDARHMILPDSVVISSLVVFTAYILTAYLFGLNDSLQNDIEILQRLTGALVLGGGLGLLWLLSKGRAIGFGDAKLMALLGLVFGWKGGLMIFYIALFSGLLFGLALITSKKASIKSRIPFGSFISGSAIIYVFFWQNILTRIESIILRAFT